MLGHLRKHPLNFPVVFIANVQVGLETELTMLEDKHEFDFDYQSLQDPSLYAIGSVVGDHFVRYLIGGAFRVAQRFIHQEFISGYLLISALNKSPRIDWLDCYLQKLKSNDQNSSSVEELSTVDVNNNNAQRKQKRPNKCFFPKIFCKLLS